MNREEWLNGWQRQEDIVRIGSSIRCAGCGHILGTTCVIIKEDSIFPGKNPDWPFSEKDCPICSKEHRNITVEDAAKLPLSILRKAISIKKLQRKEKR